MGDSYDIDGKQISDHIASMQGVSAMLSTAVSQEQRLFAAYEFQKNRADSLELKCEDLERQLAEAQALIAQLTQKPAVNVVLKENAKVEKLVTGDINEYYGQDISNQGQHNQRIGAGRETLSLVR
jgi:hypothetical protein